MSDGRVGQGDGQRRMDVSDRETDSIRWTCRTGRQTALDGRVGQGDRQRRTDVSDREADSVGRMCRTGTGGARRVSPIRRYGGNGGNGGNGDEVDIPNTIQEVA